MRMRTILKWDGLGAACVSLAAAVLAGCGPGDGSRRDVVAAFYPLAYAAQRLAPDADVRNITPAGAEPHDLELSPRVARAVAEADVVLYLGRGFMPALEDAARGHSNAVDLLAGVRLRDRDPHVWLDPTRYAALVRRIASALGEREAAAGLVAELEALDGEFRERLASCERRTIVASHAAFGYLADAYGLEQVALSGVSPEAEPGARALEALVERVRAEGATTVFVEPLVSPRLAETVAREAGARTAVLNPLEGLGDDEIEAGADYFSVMRGNLARLREALGCR